VRRRGIFFWFTGRLAIADGAFFLFELP